MQRAHSSILAQKQPNLFSRSAVDEFDVFTCREQPSRPIDLPDAGFDRPSLVLGLGDVLVGLRHLFVEIKHGYLRGGIVDCSADNRAG